MGRPSVRRAGGRSRPRARASSATMNEIVPAPPWEGEVTLDPSPSPRLDATESPRIGLIPPISVA